MTQEPPESRRVLLRRGWRLEIATVAWNTLEGIIAVAAGITAGSIALTGFGIDSGIETMSGVVVGWRLRRELQGLTLARAEELEHRASRVAGALLLALGIFIFVEAGRRLLGFGEPARESTIGIVLTAVSLAVMPFLGWVKLKTARALGSSALRADAYETIACAWLSFTTLAGLLLNSLFGWGWADPLAALALVPLILREGWEGLRGGDDDE
ncbi:MAG: cation diffusion facilitator family transporter [Vicinamibacteria bacterium]